MWFFYLLGIIAVLIVFFKIVGKTIVFEYEKGLLYQKGKLVKILDAGCHWFLRMYTVIQKVDIRPKVVTVPGQEILSSDGVTLKISIAAQYEITDPVVAINKTENYQEAVYLILQLAAREIIGSAAIDELMEKRSEFGKRLTESTKERIAALGVKLIAADIKDIMFPGELKNVFAQVVKARKEGLAILEKARGEAAALRNLANAASLVKDNPALMQLRILQTIGGTSGNTIMVGMPSSGIPIASSNKEENKEPKG